MSFLSQVLHLTYLLNQPPFMLASNFKPVSCSEEVNQEINKRDTIEQVRSKDFTCGIM